MPSGFSRQYLTQQLTQILGESLSEQQLERCILALQIIEPPIAKQFWQAATAQAGIYIVLGGKVRLLDTTNNLITTLSTGASFGELTLFPDGDFIPYVARASVNLKLGYLPQAILQELMGENLIISDGLKKHAETWDLLVLCCQNSLIPPNSSIEEIIKALALFERHILDIGAIVPSLCQNTKLWLLGRGELVDNNGRTFSAGNIFQYSKQDWRVTQSAIIYILKNENWQVAQEYWPQLGTGESSAVRGFPPLFAQRLGERRLANPLAKPLGEKGYWG